jgi:crotonobetainyl-CoA:carnitine CoA-transferase CaiB-like acyl-CoA transferase
MASAYGDILDACTALLGFYYRQRAGIGQRFEVPLGDAVLSAMALLIMEVKGKPARYNFPPLDKAMLEVVFPIFHNLGEHLTPGHTARIANHLKTLSSPMMSVYDCADGRLLFVCASDHMYQTRAFLEVVGVYEQLIAEGMMYVSPYAEDRRDNNLYRASALSPAWRQQLRTAISKQRKTVGKYQGEYAWDV